ncbi:MAG: hypothetical protein B6241_05500 [Spirochaetaceae bacterium 4572_59]|nr:MAG: hypothetical protein B6241_05500 [Spirochaetaceae bacterium 4572_59]
MYNSFHARFQLKNVTLHPGEYKVTNEQIIISTVLGSCVSVALYDPLNRQGGMNHFLLPGADHISVDDLFLLKNETRYGLYAMEILINNLIKLGSAKKNLKAKVFGGSNMFYTRDRESSIGSMNSEFALKFLQYEGIPVLSSDTGGHFGRKILYFPQEGRILLKKLESSREIKHISKDERKFDDSLIKKKGSEDIILF